MGKAKQQWLEMRDERANKRLALRLGITYEELGELEWEVEEDYSEDGLLYSYRLEFSDDGNHDILEKIIGLEDGCRVYLSPWEYEDDIEDDELEWIIVSSDQLKVLTDHLTSVKNILNLSVNQSDEFKLLVMLHAHIIASIEGYLSSTFIHHVTNSDIYMRRLIETDPEFRNKTFTLSEIYREQEKLPRIVASYLQSLIFHKMEKN